MLRQTDNCAHASRWRAKTGPVALLCTGLLLCVLCVPVRWSAPLAFASVLLAAFAGAGLPLRCFLRALAVPFGFIVVGAAALAVGIDWKAGGRLVLSEEGLGRAVETSLRAFSASSVLVLLAHTVPVGRLLGLLRRLRVPESLLDLMHLTYRNLFLLEEARESIVRAQENRLGYSSPSRAFRSSAGAGASLFVRSLQRARRMEQALAARCYDGSFRVLEAQDESGPLEWAAAGALPLAIAAASYFFERTFAP